MDRAAQPVAVQEHCDQGAEVNSSRLLAIESSCGFFRGEAYLSRAPRSLRIDRTAPYNYLVAAESLAAPSGEELAMASPTIEIEYPETDGRPMGETDLHRDWMVRIIDLLKHRYRDQRVYVTGDLLLYYEEGNPSKFVVPDGMVVKDCDPGRRRVFKVWEEKRVPCAVFETTSKSTKREDAFYKRPIYEQLGVAEYFLFDPTADYLRPALQGHRLGAAGYELIVPDAAGRLFCQELGLWLRLEDGDLTMYDCQSGDCLLTEAEDEHALRETERAAFEAVLTARDEEIQRLREKLKEQGLSEGDVPSQQ
jgi:Uma2 family endonuclease